MDKDIEIISLVASADLKIYFYIDVKVKPIMHTKGKVSNIHSARTYK